MSQHEKGLKIRDFIIAICLISNFAVLIYVHYSVASVSSFATTANSLSASPQVSIVSSLISLGTLFFYGILFGYMSAYYISIRNGKLASSYVGIFLLVFLIFDMLQLYLIGVI